MQLHYPYGQTKFYKTHLRSLLFQIRDGVTQIRNAGAGPQPQMTTFVYFNLEFPFQQPLGIGKQAPVWGDRLQAAMALLTPLLIPIFVLRGN